MRSPAPRNIESTSCAGRHWIPVHRNHAHPVSGQRDAPIFNRARIQKMNQQPLPFAHADRIARSKRLVVDRVGHRSDFKPIRFRIHHCRLFQQRPVVRIVIIVVHVRREERLPIANREKQFLVVLSRVISAIDIDKSKLPGVCALMQICHGHGMRVVPAAAGRTRSERKAPSPVRLNQRRAFFLGAIDLRRNQHSVPMNQLRRISLVDHINAHRFSFAHPQNRSRRRAVIANGRKNVRRVEFDLNRRNAQCVIRLALRGLACIAIPACASLCPRRIDRAAAACANAAPPSLSNSRRFTVSPSFLSSTCLHRLTRSTRRTRSGQRPNALSATKTPPLSSITALRRRLTVPLRQTRYV